MTTYAHMIEVSKNPDLTNSQKLHELFKDAKTEPASKGIENFSLTSNPMPDSFPSNAETVAFEANGQILIVRFEDNTYHAVDFGLGDENDNTLVQSFDEFDEEIMEQIWDSYLSTDDVPVALYDGGFIDSDLELSFLDSFPE